MQPTRSATPGWPATPATAKIASKGLEATQNPGMTQRLDIASRLQSKLIREAAGTGSNETTIAELLAGNNLLKLIKELQADATRYPVNNICEHAFGEDCPLTPGRLGKKLPPEIFRDTPGLSRALSKLVARYIEGQEQRDDAKISSSRTAMQDLVHTAQTDLRLPNDSIITLKDLLSLNYASDNQTFSDLKQTLYSSLEGA